MRPILMRAGGAPAQTSMPCGDTCRRPYRGAGYGALLSGGALASLANHRLFTSTPPVCAAGARHHAARLLEMPPGNPSDLRQPTTEDRQSTYDLPRNF